MTFLALFSGTSLHKPLHTPLRAPPPLGLSALGHAFLSLGCPTLVYTFKLTLHSLWCPAQIPPSFRSSPCTQTDPEAPIAVISPSSQLPRGTSLLSAQAEFRVCRHVLAPGTDPAPGEEVLGLPQPCIPRSTTMPFILNSVHCPFIPPVAKPPLDGPVVS